MLFGKIPGKYLFSLEKDEFEKYAGRQEGPRLCSQIRIQRSLADV
jgi:hypothetical protein